LSSQENHRLLAVFAHPDDESFGPGGTLALYAQQGVDVHLICATRGEAGEISAAHTEPVEDIAVRREQELHCAASKLGLAQVHLLGYRDSGMAGSPDNDHPLALAQAPQEKVVHDVAQIIRQVRPHVVITHDPIGGYRHPDHICMHHATVKAFHAAADPTFSSNGAPPYQPQKLYFSTFSRIWLRILNRLAPIMGRDPRRWGRNADIDLVDIAEQNIPIHARLNIRSVAHLKEQAAACHASQQGGSPPNNRIINWLLQLEGKKETFMRAYPPAPPGLRERDLFAGVVNIDDPAEASGPDPEA